MICRHLALAALGVAARGRNQIRCVLAAALAGTSAILLAGQGEAASFNCNLAKLPAEVAICQDEILGGEDEELAREYFALTNAAPGWAVAEIRAEQKAWLRDRNACGYDMQCIMGTYRGRLQRLGEWRDQISGGQSNGGTGDGESVPLGDPTGDPD